MVRPIVGGAFVALVSLAVAARARLRRRSRLLLGAPPAAEADLAAALGAGLAASDLRRFLTLAQRLVWGVTQGDLIRVDLAALQAQLLREFGGIFVAHLVVAFALRAAGQPEAAAAALSRARTLATPDHPLAYLLPTAAEWAGEAPDPKPAQGEPEGLEEVVPGRIWRHAGYFTHGESPLLEVAYATILRREDGRLVIYNPMAMTPAIVAAIRELGEVTHLVIATKFHSLFIAGAQEAFPAAATYGVPGHRTHPHSAHLRFDGFLRPGSPLFPGEVDEIVFTGHEFEEVAMIHRATRTAILSDLLLTNPRDPGLPSFWLRLYAFVWGIDDRLALPGYQGIMWTRFGGVRRALRELLAADIDHLLLAHAPTSATFDQGRERLAAAIGWAAALSPAEHLLLTVDFFVRQPGFAWDFVRYLLR